VVRARTSFSGIDVASSAKKLTRHDSVNRALSIDSAALSSGLDRCENDRDLSVLIRHKTYA
jgi:hypothetical protein